MAPYAEPDVRRGLLDLATSVVPYLALTAAMYVLSGLLRCSRWSLRVPAAGFLLRTFIVFHDCTHGSFFADRRANKWVGIACALLVFTPFHSWRHEHAVHHATAGRSRQARHGRRRHAHGRRIPRALTAGAPRLPADAQSVRAARRSGRCGRCCSNPASCPAGRAGGSGARSSPPMSRSSRHRRAVRARSAGGRCCSSSCRRRCSPARPEYGCSTCNTSSRTSTGSATTTGATRSRRYRGSSHLKLPKILQFFTGNIGLHHVHHLSPRIPNYNLQRAHDENPVFHDVPTLTCGTASARCGSSSTTSSVGASSPSPQRGAEHPAGRGAEPQQGASIAPARRDSSVGRAHD